MYNRLTHYRREDWENYVVGEVTLGLRATAIVQVIQIAVLPGFKDALALTVFVFIIDDTGRSRLVE